MKQTLASRRRQRHVLPDSTSTATSIDGGVVFANVPAGDYTLTATKPGVSFSTIDIRCRAGVLVKRRPAARPAGVAGGDSD